MVQAAVLDGLVFDASPFSQDGFAAPLPSNISTTLRFASPLTSM